MANSLITGIKYLSLILLVYFFTLKMLVLEAKVTLRIIQRIQVA